MCYSSSRNKKGYETGGLNRRREVDFYEEKEFFRGTGHYDFWCVVCTLFHRGSYRCAGTKVQRGWM